MTLSKHAATPQKGAAFDEDESTVVASVDAADVFVLSLPVPTVSTPMLAPLMNESSSLPPSSLSSSAFFSSLRRQLERGQEEAAASR